MHGKYFGAKLMNLHADTQPEGSIKQSSSMICRYWNGQSIRDFRHYHEMERPSKRGAGLATLIKRLQKRAGSPPSARKAKPCRNLRGRVRRLVWSETALAPGLERHMMG